ncbi:MAG TPA: hypothetical protein VL793_05085, partial [Patescibacteria group bacterium]|nr:hypothetical protein [Patescibacteria group bacterium]
MKTNLLSMSLGLLSLVAGFESSVHACGLPQFSLEALAQRAVSENKVVSDAAIAQLRATGPQGLNLLLKANAAAISQHESPSKVIGGDTREPRAWIRLTRALDLVSGQCDAFASKLYWYTDFKAATAAAKTSGKPILSLRLLGRLDEEYSCANSRFFRTTLYANAEVSRYLRDHFILHWQSVRPVPRITIDFGDGRKIERTITGNSAHYILDSNGQVVDVLPGLYGPKAFLQQLNDDEQLALACAGLSAEQRQERLAAYHAQKSEATARAWSADLARLGERPIPLPVANFAPRLRIAPSAKLAGNLAISKRAVEAPLLKSTEPAAEEERPARASISDDLWAAIAALHAGQGRLDSA